MAVLKSSLILSLIDNVSGRARGINSALGSLQRGHASFLGMAGRLAAFGGAYVGVTQGMSGTVGAALEFESAFADVRKVLDANDEQMANVRRSIIAMSKELPIAASGIAEIYAAAGQANIPLAEITKFSEMVAKVSTAWDVPVAETGQALAEIKNQLNLGVNEVGLFADSLNHLSNNTAANAPRLLEYTKRVAATGEMFGFSAQETLAFGGAMISSGGEAEVAATSFRNMGRALTIGTRATKTHNTAFKRLGLDAVKTAKSMQKNALKTTLDVIDRIQTLPEWERISIASALFGDEARALMPVINNATELRRQLGLVGNEANYAGSAFKEYTIRASTVGNVLQILKNKFADFFRSMGDDMLPGIKQAALGVGHILDTMGERATIFDKMGAAMEAFLQGFGVDSGIRETVESIGDLLFGKADGSASADQLGRIFAKFKEYGASVRELSDAIRNNPIAQFLGELGADGFKLMLAAVGIGILAGAVRKLAAALLFLSGASTVFGILKTLAGLGGDILGLPGGKGKTPKTPTGGKPKGKVPFSPLTWGLAGISGFAWLMNEGADSLRNDPARQARDNEKSAQNIRWLKNLLGLKKDEAGVSGLSRFMFGAAADPGFDSRQHFGVETKAASNTPVIIDSSSIAAMNQPSGVQQVAVTNPQPIEITVNAPITISGVSSPEAAADAAASRLGQAVKSTVGASWGGPR
ncbi:phage tail tape measure protein [Shinella sumterensis]|uniref:Phage tail tape measure protein n=1 Tax=Shinella sumterensis TaxID=1967501 RepID=A0AA50H585_9HYPH|nr:phage tail tape measure protein [Shinella sumterensis]WLR98639.1 phage tail tape measure protein [Shinella sumterensis]